MCGIFEKLTQRIKIHTPAKSASFTAYAMKHLFTYGSLMFEQVWHSVVKGNYQRGSATLHGYQRLAVRGEDYPVIKPAANNQVKGVIYYHVSRPDLKKLDDFEGSCYTRQKVSVIVDNQPLQADAYLLKPRFYSIATHPWDPDEFAVRGLKRFMARYKRFAG